MLLDAIIGNADEAAGGGKNLGEFVLRGAAFIARRFWV